MTTKIETCDSTASPWTGCTPVSEGCANCYARTLAKLHGWSAEWDAGVPRHRFVGFEKSALAMERKAERGHFKDCQECGWRGFVSRSMKGRCPNPECAIPLYAVNDARPRVFPSLCDWLDPEVPVEWLADLLDVIRRTPHLDWMLLTKRPGLWTRRVGTALSAIGSREGYPDNGTPSATGDMVAAWLDRTPPPNVWIGATCEDQAAADSRVPDLLRIPARVRFLSCEPMLGPVDLLRTPLVAGRGYGWANALQGTHPSLTADMMRGPSIDWVIAGGESGPNARPMHPEWARSLRDQCVAAGVPFLFKQWGEWVPRSACINCGTDWAEVDPTCSKYPHVVRMCSCGGDTRTDTGPLPVCQCGGNGDIYMQRVGKARAGRMLDGREWNEFPKQEGGVA